MSKSYHPILVGREVQNAFTRKDEQFGEAALGGTPVDHATLEPPPKQLLLPRTLLLVAQSAARSA
jgi:hypothetical protein